ncbi:transcriptional regulator [Actinorhabdospora filicis]|uniref:Transcriptional regulator n=1 Tax=Actinorhabdospora filicis TaxID=1785913 RepID=A0A9W6SQ20_9ACTN|nr:helix-turn-helix domain-containing protein [Actinorhabdospora filicis]GLZ80864.1 transcriptional regulator [Actinorhabdospora filicis]
MATSTAAERRAEERRAYDAFLSECASHNLLDQISNKWVTLVISALGEGPKRYSDLARAIPGVSQKMLTQTLRIIERDGLVTRTVTAAVPVRVDYALTDLGDSLRALLGKVKCWAEEHMDFVYLAREAYDAREEQTAVAALNRKS